MDTHPSSDIENVQYTQLHGDDSSLKARHSFKLSSIIIASFLVIITLVCSTIIYYNTNTPKTMPYSEYSTLEERGVAEGVSAKSNHHFFSKNDASFNWTNSMFSWQRTAYHFQPEENFMNDPDGPLYYKGWYHIFYQYNPYSAVWGNINWGHAVSKDLIHWMYLPLAMVPDHWYDIDGVWTGSATLLPNGQIKMLYTGSTANSVQVQNLAYPANPSDPLLLDWIKYSGNPVLEPPSWIGIEDFRDPTTAWQGLNGTWRIAIGSRVNITTGITLVYQTTNFITYEFLNIMHAVPGTGMWECVDFFPVSTTGSQGLDTSANGPGIKHVLKASLDVTKLDYYAIGTYDPVSNKWTPDNPDKDVGIGWKVDYGRYYASKTFYDQYKKRRILWGWTNETDTEYADLSKGWASLQTIPRTVVFDKKTGANILQWPVEELESLRLNSSDFEIEATPGSVIPIDLGAAVQLDITAKFSVDVSGSEVTSGDHTCGNGATDRTTFGPFGLLVIADDTLSELTPIYFRISNSTSGILNTYFCVDETRSSLAPAVFKNIYGDKVPVLEDEKLQMRVLVDHSMVESFAQEGRMVISSRIYPTKAIHGAARLFLFNNATGATIKASLKIWEMNSAFIHPFAFDQTQ